MRRTFAFSTFSKNFNVRMYKYLPIVAFRCLFPFSNNPFGKKVESKTIVIIIVAHTRIIIIIIIACTYFIRLDGILHY